MPKSVSKPLPKGIAIIGFHGRFPKSETPEELWENLCAGRVCTEEIPEVRWVQDKVSGVRPEGKWGSFLKDVEMFDPLLFNIAPREAAEMDPQLRLFLESVWTTMEVAGYGKHRQNPSCKIGLYVGTMWHEYSLYSHENGYLRGQYLGPGTLSWAIANRTSFIMNFTGPSVTLDTACASSSLAVHLACQGLIAGECEMAVAGGVNLNLHPSKFTYLAQEKLLSGQPDKACFQSGAEGYLPGEGVGSVLLKPLEKAVADRDYIWGVIRGTGTNHNGRGFFFKVPDSESQARLLRDTYRKAGVDPATISYLEMSAYGSEMVDTAELSGLEKFFRDVVGREKQFCALGTLKPNLGHLEAASGIAQIIKVLLQFSYQKLPPSIFAERLAPEFNLAGSPFFLQRELAEWRPRKMAIEGKIQTVPRRAGLSSFGAGGTNVHLILEEYPQTAGTVKSRSLPSDGVLIILSAQDLDRLREYVRRFHDFASRPEFQKTLSLANLAYSLQTGREAMKERIVFQVRTLAELHEKTSAFLNGSGPIDGVYQGTAVKKGSGGKTPDWVKTAEPQELAAQWVEGAALDWSQIYCNKKLARVPAPTYPFARQRFWITDHRQMTAPERITALSQFEPNQGPIIREQLTTYLKVLIAGELQISEHLIDPTESLTVYGLDSLTIRKLNVRLEKDFGPLPKTIFFEYGTIEELTEYLMREHLNKLNGFLNLNHPQEGILFESAPMTMSLLHERPSGGPAKDQPLEIAIIGLAGRYPLADSFAQFWENLKSGRDCITEIPGDRWDYRSWYDPDRENIRKTYTRWGGFLSGVDQFDPLFFKIAPREAELMDPQERLFLETAWEVVEDAGYTVRSLRDEQVGVFVGVMWGEYQFYGVEETRRGNAVTPSSAYWSIPNRVSYLFNFRGPSIAIDTACSSSLTAIHLACESLRRNECSMVIAGGVSLSLHPAKYLYLSQRRFASSDGKCRSFGADGDGYVPGEGVGAVLLKPLARAVANGDHIYGVIKGSRISHGGKTTGYTVPSPVGQADLIQKTLENAAVDPRSIGYIEAHGTGTALGDPIEIEGLTRAFQPFTADRQFCSIGSVKSNIGHLESAAGMAGLTKVLLQMKYQKLLPSLHAEKINPNIDFLDSPFYLQTTLAEWEPLANRHTGGEKIWPRRAGISSFGAGGSGAFLVIEEFFGQPEEPAPGPDQSEIILISAKTQDRLMEYVRKLKNYLIKESEDNLEAPVHPATLREIAYTLQVGREALEKRLAVIVHGKIELIEKLTGYLEGRSNIENLDPVCQKSGFGEGDVEPVEKGEQLDRLFKNKRFSEIAKLWAEGKDIDWRLLNSSRKQERRISLPTYPFHRERFWVGGDYPNEMESNVRNGVLPKLHPLLDRNISDFRAQKFILTLTGHEFYLTGHLVDERKVLPGAACLEMARAAGEFSGGARVTSIQNVNWFRPLTVGEEPETIEIRLYPSGEEVDFEIVPSDEAGTVFARGRLAYENNEKNKAKSEFLDLDAVKKSSPHVVDRVEYYRRLAEAGLKYGPDFQTIQTLYYHEKEAFSQLALPKERRAGFAAFGLHPALIDGALQTALQLIPEREEGFLYLPFAMAEVEIFNTPMENCYAYVTPENGPDSVDPNIWRFRVQITGETGELLVKIKGFSLRKTLREELHAAVGRRKPVSPEIMFYQSVWEKAILDGATNCRKNSGGIMIFDLDEELSQAFRERMKGEAQEISLSLVKPGLGFRELGNHVYEINPGDGADYRRLLESLRSRNLMPDQVVHYWSRGNFEGSDEILKNQLQKGIYTLDHLSRTLLEQKPTGKIQLLYLFQSGREGAPPQDAAVNGFVRTIRQENPLFLYKTVELQYWDLDPAKMVEILLREFRDPHAETAVCYARGQRLVKRYVEFKPDAGFLKVSPFRENGVYLITGGAGGLGLIFAEYLARKYRAKLALIGRSILSPSRVARLQKMESSGAEVAYFPADVSRYKEVEKLVREVKNRFQAINGIIHSAGVVRDSFLLKKTSAEIDEVFAPKIYGTVHLDEVTREENLDFFVLFSSTAAVLGNPGQSDYAYANSFLDHFARRRESWRTEGKRSGKTLSINWPYWQEGGMTLDQASLARLYETVGMVPLTTEKGLQAFETALFSGFSQVISLDGEKQRFQQALSGNLPVFKETTNVPGFTEAAINQLRQKVETYLKEILARETKLAPLKISVLDPLENYGLDSIMSMNLTRELEKSFGPLSKTLFYEYQNLADLAGYFLQNHPEKVFVKKETQATVIPSIAVTAAPETEHSLRPRFWVNNNLPLTDQFELLPGEIAIIGLSGRYPMARNLLEFWDNLKNGYDCITEIPQERWNYQPFYNPDKDRPGKIYSKWGGFLDGVELFDSLFFKISPREAELIDPQERLFLETVWETIENAGYTKNSLAKGKVGVFVGVMWGLYQLWEAERDGGKLALSSSYASVANRVSYFFDFRGPSITLDTMCSSSLTAIHWACQSIRAGECEVAVAGGVNLSLHPQKYFQICQGKFASTDGRCRSFGAGGDGYVPGEGVGAVLLKPLTKAVADGDHIYGVIKGSAINHGGKTNGYTVPNPNAQAEVITAALQKGGIDPATISYLEAHGTGTSLGDPIEITGLTKAFREYTEKSQFCAIGSAKSNIGHLEAAAGIAGLTKVLLQMRYRQLVPTLHAAEVNPHLDFDHSPFFLQRELSEWPQPEITVNGKTTGYPRRAGISSFGAGGANAHLIVEEYLEPDHAVASEESIPQLIVLSAKNEERLRVYTGELAKLLVESANDGDKVRLRDLAYTLQTGREAMEERLALVVSSLAELWERLTEYSQGKTGLQELFRGNTGKDPNSDLLVEGREGSEFLKIIINEGKLTKLARLWVSGVELDWRLLYTPPFPRRIPLPNYPFARERCWAPEPLTNQALKGAYRVDKLHPLLDRNISDFRSQKFNLRLSGEEFFLTDHLVQGRKVVPGVVFLEMARAAAEIAGGKPVRRLQNIVWARPVSVTGEAREVEITLYPNVEMVDFEISPSEELSTVSPHVSGCLVYEQISESKKEYEPIDLEAIKKRCYQSTNGVEFYRRFQAAGLSYGPDFQAVKELHKSETEVLAHLVLPQFWSDDGRKFILQPSLMDGVLQATAGFNFSQENEELLLPFGLGEMEVIRPLTENCYVHVTGETTPTGAGSPVRKFQIQVTDEDGQILLRLKDFTLKVFRGGIPPVDLNVRTNCPELMYFQSIWVEAELRPAPEDWEKVPLLIFDTNRKLYQFLIDRREKVSLVMPGKCFRETERLVYEINPEDQAGYSRLLESLRRQNFWPVRVIHHWPESGFNGAGKTIETQFLKGIYALFHLSKALMELKNQEKVQLLYLYQSDQEGSEPLHAGVGGFFRTIRRENPQFGYRTIEFRGPDNFPDPARLAETVLRELQSADDDLEICYWNGQRLKRYFQEYTPKSESENPLFFKKGGVYLITGGAGGLGLIFAEYLAHKFQARLALTGRSDLNPEKQARLKELEVGGAEVVYFRADISKRDEVTELIAKVKMRFQGMNGIIHSAGVLRDAFLFKKTPEEMEEVLAPKVYGAVYLDEATCRELLDFFVVFSSVTAVLGNLGQSDYAYANGFLDNFARWREGLRAEGNRSGNTISINWPLWRRGGMAVDEPAKLRLRESMGMVPLETERGLEAFEAVLGSGLSQALVVEGEREKFTRYLIDDQQKAAGEEDHAKPVLGGTEPGESKTELQEKIEAYLKEVLAKETKVPVERISSREPLEKYGLDSVMVMSLTRELESIFGDLSKTLFYEYQSLTALTGYFLDHHHAKVMARFDGSPITKVESAFSVSMNEEATGPVRPRFLEREGWFGHPDLPEEIAIIGLSGRYPMASDLTEFWENLRQGRDCISEIPLERWDFRRFYDPDPERAEPGKTNSKWGGFLEGVDCFDPLFFNITPREAELIDPQERLFLETVWEVVEDAGYSRTALSGVKVGVFVGVMWGQYQLFDRDLQGMIIAPASSYASIANRVSYFFNFHGPSIALDTMCSSSLTAIHLACESIGRRESELAVAGGVNLSLHPNKYLQLSRSKFTSSDGWCRSFGAGGDGYVPGEGVGAVLLKPLSKAVADRNHIYGVIKASAINHGGKTNGYTVPNPNAQAAVIAEVLKKAKLNPETISYLEAHGTGTALGDPIEIAGLVKAFQENASHKQYCAIGSVKSNIGHLEAAAGMAGLTKILLQMKYQQLAPSLHIEKLNPHLHLEDSPFYLQSALEDWNQSNFQESVNGKILPRRAGISSFGAGGANAHLIVEEYQNSENYSGLEPQKSGPVILALSAKNEERLKVYAGRMVNFLEKPGAAGINDNLLSDFAYTLQVGREEMEERLALIESSIAELREQLNHFCRGNLEIRNLFRGNAACGVVKPEFLFEGKEGDEFLKTITRERKLAKIAQLWVFGAKIDWRSLYAPHLPRRLALPTYPFARERYWVRTETGAGETTGRVIKLHPLLDRNTSNLREQKFTVTLTGQEFYLTDHLVNGGKVMPGVVIMEMARAAGEFAGEAQVLKIKDLVWEKPVIFNEGSRNLDIILFPDRDQVEFEVCSSGEGHRRTYARGRLIFKDDGSGQPDGKIDFETVKNRCLLRKSQAECYHLFQSMGLTYGPGFQTIRELSHSETATLALVELPEELEGGFEEFGLHPSLMDGAFQAMIGLNPDWNSKRLYLPYTLGEVEILRPLPPSCYVYLTYTGEGDWANRQFQIEITDPDGKVSVRLKDLSLRPFRHSVAETDSSVKLEKCETMYFSCRWENTELNPDLTGWDQEDRILIFDTGEEFGRILTGRLADRGLGNLQVFLVKPGKKYREIGNRRYEINPEREEDYRRLVESLQRQNFRPGKIIHRWSQNFSGETISIQERLIIGIYSVFNLSRALMAKRPTEELKLLFLLGPNPEDSPYYAAVSGFAKTVRLENPLFRFKIIEIQSLAITGVETVELVLSEFQAENDGIDLRYQDGRRLVKHFEEVVSRENIPQTLPFKQGGVYLITGGAGGLGMIFAKYLAEKYQARLALTGRSELNTEKRARLNELELMGAEVAYFQTDVAKREEVTELVTKVKARFSVLNGVIHSAGVFHDAFILKKTLVEMAEVLAPKVFGVVNLDEATREEELDFFITFSSTAAVLGNVGQSDYAYGNSFLDHYAWRREELRAEGRRSGLTFSINWPLWQEGGMRVDEPVKARMRELTGMVPLGATEGIKALENCFRLSKPQIVVITGIRPKVRQAFRNVDLRKNGEGARSEISPPEKALLQEKTEAYLKEVVAGETKLPVDKILSRDPFDQYGIDSVMVMSLTRKLERTFGELSKTLFYEYQNLAALAEYFIENHRVKLTTLTGEPVIASSLTVASAGETPQPLRPRFWNKVGLSGESESIAEEIAIIGVSGRYPMARDLEEFWENLKAGKDCITEIPRERWNWEDYFSPEKGQPGRSYSKWGGFIEGADRFDPLFFNISPREAELMDPQERLFLETAWQTIEDAGYTTKNLAGGNVGVFVGVMWGQYQLWETEIDGVTLPASSSFASVSNRVSYFGNFHGPSIALDTMCSSSLTAIHLACDSIRKGDCEIALAGGVNLSVHPNKYLLLSRSKFLSGDGRCRSFGAGGDGYVPGEGVGAVLLKPLAGALADGDQIYGVIKGSAINHGGKTNSYTVPNPNAQAGVIAKALKKAKVDPRSISYLEAHGTGTSLGDPIEITGLIKAFGENSQDRQYCAIGSLKSNIGHLEPAAGIAGLTKVLLQMKYRKLVPSIRSETLNPHINFLESPFYVQRGLTDWEELVTMENGMIIKHPRRAGISSFGAGGANAHLIVEEYQNPVSDWNGLVGDGPQIIVLSAKNEERLRVYAGLVAAFLEKARVLSIGQTNNGIELTNLAYTLQVGREAMDERLALIVADLGELEERLKEYSQGKTVSGEIYRGNLKTGRVKTEFLNDGKESAAFLNIVIKERKFAKLGQLWVSGVEIDWSLLYPHRLPNRISLPVYPFARERCWVLESTEVNSRHLVKTLSQSGISGINGKAPAIKEASRQTAVSTIITEKSGIDFKEKLGGLFSRILKIPLEQIDPETPFTNYGVDSVILVELLQEIEKLVSVRLEPALLLEYQTIEALNGYLKEIDNGVTSGEVEVGISQSSAPGFQFPKVMKKNSQEPGTSLGNSSITILGSSGHFPEEAFQNYWKNFKDGVPASIGKLDPVEDYLRLGSRDDWRMLHLLVETSSKQKMEVIMSGRGPTILLINGFGLTAPQWFYQFQDWPAYQLVVIHPPGAGLSEIGAVCTLSEISKLYLDVLDKLPIRWPIHVVGASWGGMVAQTMAKEYPEKVASLVLAGSFSRFAIDIRNYTLREKFAKDFDNETGRPYYPLILKSESVSPVAILKYFEDASQGISTWELLPEIKTPTLIIAGERDQVVDPNESRLLHSRIPNSEYYEFAEAGHLPNLTHHREFNRIVSKFIDARLRKDHEEANRWLAFYKPNREARLRLFCFHSGIEGASQFRWWQTKLPGWIEVCPIQMPGRENRMAEKPVNNMEEAVEVLEKVISSKIDLPYVFYGHRSGALIAFRLAIRLQKNRWPLPSHLLVGACAAPQICPNLYLKSVLPQFRKMGYQGIPDPGKVDQLIAVHQEQLWKLPVVNLSGIRNKKMGGLFLPLVISDLKLMEGADRNKEMLDFSITAFHGADDLLVSRDEMKAWGELTSGFRLHILPGDQFFLHEDRSQEELLTVIVEEIKKYR